jgi:hypothetical protein
MPQDGESRMDAADVYAHCLLRITELAAGRKRSECISVTHGPRSTIGDKNASWPASLHPRRKASKRSSASASSKPPRSCAGMRMSPLPSDALVRQRTLNTTEIAATISTAVARKMAADEADRRRQWARRIKNAKIFRSCDG